MRAGEVLTGTYDGSYGTEPIAGTVTGNFIALDAETGADLWRRPLGGEIIAAPMPYLSNDRQHVTIAAGHAIFTFVLPR